MPDAIVIGGGVIGLLSARALRQRGFGVTLLERDRPGRQASWASAGILSVPHPLDRTPAAILKRRSHELYPDLVAAVHQESGVDPEMTMDGHLVSAFDAATAREIRADAESEPGSEYVEGADVQRA